MPPKKLPPPAPLQKGTTAEGPPVKAGGKEDLSAIVKKASVSTPPRPPPASPLAAAKVNLPVQPSLKRRSSASDKTPLSSPLDDARATTAGAATATAGGPASPPRGPPSGHIPPPAVAHAPSVPGVAAARAASELKTEENEVVKQPPSSLPPSIAAAPVTSTAGPKPPASARPSLPASSKETSPPTGVLPSVPPFKKEGELLTRRSLSLLAPQPTADAAAAAAPVSTSPGPGGTPAAAKGKIPPAPVAKKGPLVPPAEGGARPVDLDAHPAAKEKTPAAPSGKNGPPIHLAKQGAPSPSNLKAVPPGAKGGKPSAPPPKKVSPTGLAIPVTAKESPTKTFGAKPVAASAASVSASGDIVAPGSTGTPQVASSPAVVPGSGVGPSAPVRMKTGLVGVGPPPGALLKIASPGKAESSASTAVGASLRKKEGPCFGADVKTAPAVTAAAAAVEGKEVDSAARRKEAGDSASGRPHPLSALAAPLCEIVDQTGKFVGLAHGPPPPLTAQEPKQSLLCTGRCRGSGLWQSDRLAPEEPVPCSSRSTLQRASRRRAGAADTCMGGVQYMPPFGVPPGWNTLPGFFFPAPACPLFFPQQSVSADYPTNPTYPPRRRSSSHRSRDTRLRPSSKSVPEQSAGAPADLAGGEQYGCPSYYYNPMAYHPFFAYPYYTAMFDMNPYVAALHTQQQSQQPQGPAYGSHPSGTAGIYSPLRRSRPDRLRRHSRGQTAEASADSVGSESCFSSDEDDDPLRLTSKLRAPTSGQRGRSVEVGLREPSTVPRRRTTKYAPGEREERIFGFQKKLQDEAHSISSLDDIGGTREEFRRPTANSQRQGTEDTYAGFDRLDYQAALSSGPPARTHLRGVADASVYGRTPWSRVERKLNHIRGGYGLTGSVPPERLPAQVERQEQVAEGGRSDLQQVDRVTSRRTSVEAATSATARRSSKLRHSWLRELPAGHAEEQREAEEFIGGDPYYKHFHTHYQRSKKPWVDEVGYPMGAPQRRAGLGSLPASGESSSRRWPRRRWDRWSFERGLTAPRRRTYQSLNELAAHFSRIEGEDQDELISLLLLTRRLEKQIDEQRLVIDDLEHELTTASATLKFPPEWRALEGIDLVSLVPADSAFQPSAATPLFLKSAVLLPKQLPDGSSAFTGVPATALVDAATGAPAPSVAAPSQQVGAATASPPAAGTGKPAAPGTPAPPSAAGVAKPPTTAAAGASGGPKPPPPSVGMKKTLKLPGAVKKPTFKTSIKAKGGS